VDVLVIALFGAIIIAVTWGYDMRWRVPAPTIGVLDYTDITALAIIVVIYPFVALVEPPAVAAIINGAIIVSAVTDLATPILKVPALRRALIVTSIAVLILLATSHSGPVPGWALTNLLLTAVVVTVAAAWAQLGATTAHLAVLAVFLAAYDIVATALTGFMGQLASKLSSQPIPFIFTLPADHGTAYLGVGDMLILALVPITVRHTHRHHAALAAATVMYGAYLAGLLIAAAHPGETIPLMITLAPAILAINTHTLCSKSRPNAAPTVASAPLNASSPTLTN
jgi:hypothetical protein